MDFLKSQKNGLKTDQQENSITEMKNQRKNEFYTFIKNETTRSQVSETPSFTKALIGKNLQGRRSLTVIYRDRVRNLIGMKPL